MNSPTGREYGNDLVALHASETGLQDIKGDLLEADFWLASNGAVYGMLLGRPTEAFLQRQPNCGNLTFPLTQNFVVSDDFLVRVTAVLTVCSGCCR